MITRFATLVDIPQVIRLLMQFSQEATVGFRTPRSDDQTRLARMVGAWQKQHYVRVAEQDQEITGILIAEIGTDFWDPDRRLLQERAWYVTPEYRHTRAGAALWRAWDRDVTEYLTQGRVQAVLLSTQGPATAFDPGRRGWRLIEQTWMRET
jgi:hypothetical protein